MLRSIHIGCVFLVAISLLQVSCSAEASKARIVKAGVSHGPSHSFTQALEQFGEMLEDRTGGRYRVRVYNSAQLGSEKEMQEMLTLGTAEITVTGLLNTYEPLFSVFELPYLYDDREHILRVNTGDVMREVSSSLLPMGLRLIGFYENGFRNITNSVRPIHTPEDVEGLMIRTPENPAQIQTFKAFGAIPTPLSFSELYTALLQGLVDGQENPLQNIWYGRLFEVQQYLAMTHHIYNSAYVLISERFWNELSESDREIFRECVLESSVWQLDYMRKLDRELEQKLKDEGMEFTHPDREPFEKAAQPAYDALYEKLGPRAEEIVEEIERLKSTESVSQLMN